MLTLIRKRTKHTMLARVVRLGAFLLCAQLGLSVVLARQVKAEVEDLMLGIGSQMMQLGERERTMKPRTIVLNGAELRIRVQTVHGRELGEVLDTFEERCRSRAGGFHELLAERPLALPRADADIFDGVMRADTDGAGMVACLDVGEHDLSGPALLERLGRFAKTGDASAIGHLRYVRAQRSGKDVFLVMLWNDGPLPLKQMFPVKGDAPGLDFPHLPRPPHSRRLLTAWEEGQAPALSVYEAKAQTADSIDAHYRRVLPGLGWLATNPVVAGTKRTRGLMVMREGATTIVATSSTKQGNALVSMLPMDTRGAVSMDAARP